MANWTLDIRFFEFLAFFLIFNLKTVTFFNFRDILLLRTEKNKYIGGEAKCADEEAVVVIVTRGL